MVIVDYIMQSEIALRSTMSVILADQEDTGKSYVESQDYVTQSGLTIQNISLAVTWNPRQRPV